MKEVIIFIVGFMVGGWAQESQAQTYIVTNPQGQMTGSVQIQGNQAQFVTPQGYIANSATIYSNQVVTPSGAAIGTSTGYTVPSVPMSPPSPRVMQ